MSFIFRPLHIICLAISTVLFFAGAVASEVPASDFPPVKLRGYGTLSGTFTPGLVAGKPVSMLKIVCEDESKAKLVLAKYLSDLQELAPVKETSIPETSGPIPAYEAAGQGFLLAGRDGTSVYILTAPAPDLLAQWAKQELPEGNALVFKKEVDVPMALDRFDKYGLQCYFHPYSEPSIQQKANGSTFDHLKTFEFAQQENHMGLVIGQEPAPQEDADGISKGNQMDWVRLMARKFQLPLGINLDVHGTFALGNRYPEQMLQYQPQFLGGWYGSMNFGIDKVLSWDGFEAKEIALGEVQDAIRERGKDPNITDWLEAHSEIGAGIADYMDEYGPSADQGYRIYLQSTYGDLATVSQRWHGDPAALKSWDDVHVPEIYSFLGWGPDAIDLTGIWHINYDAPFDATSAAPGLDDSSWSSVPAPGHAIVQFLPRKPAVFRRHVTIDPGWRKAHDKVWIYVWDLADNRPNADYPGDFVQVFINGKLIPEVPRRISEAHWTALDVSGQLVDGDNLVAIDLPKGMFNGRVYLSPREPLHYPNLGPQINAQWADFADWNRWVRERDVNRGSQMIRQVDPISGIKLAAPGDYTDGIKNTAKAYGGDFHDTGAEGGFWNERLPALMRGANLPNTAEPGGPAKNAFEFEGGFGRWITEGVNQIDYFMEVGDLEWIPDVRQCLDENRAIFTSVGKYHPPVAQVAELYSNRNSYLMNFPWSDGYHPASNPDHLNSGYWVWNARAFLRNHYESDGLSESSFANGDAGRYKVILDSNTSIIDDKLLAGIEQYVRDGGTFVTFVQTGRHTSTVNDAWPIEKLTGYHVTALNQKNPWQNNALKWAAGQNIFSGGWLNARADGLSMKKVAGDAQDLAYWKDDGSVAIGMRPLGKGVIIEVGCRFTNGGVPQRFDYDVWDYFKGQGSLAQYGFPPTTEHGLFTPELRATQQLFTQIVQWRDIEPMPMRFEPASEHVMMRHDISNNGLYDVWSLWNDSLTDSVSGHLAFEHGTDPGWQINLKDGRQSPVVDHRLDIKLAPHQLSIYMTPRNALAASPSEWFNLQRHWWQGTDDPGKPFPVSSPKLDIDLTPDWAFKPLDATADVTPLVDPQLNDSDWKRMELGIFSLPDYPDVKHGLFRKQFTVPAGWDKGKVQMTIQHWVASAILDKGRIFLDGKLIPNASDGLIDNDLDGALKAGSTHLLAIEVTGGKTELVGVRGPAWISYHPDPEDRLDLSGNWDISTDYLHYAPATLPGSLHGTAARRTFKIDQAEASRTVVVHAVSEGRLLHGLIINGRFVSPHHHYLSPEQNLNVTPWIKFGQDNELILLSGGKGTLKEVSLEFHKKGTYP